MSLFIRQALPRRPIIEPLPTITSEPGRSLHNAALPTIAGEPVSSLGSGITAIATVLPTVTSAAATASSNEFHLVTPHSSQSSLVQTIAPTIQLSEIIAKPATTTINSLRST